MENASSPDAMRSRYLVGCPPVPPPPSDSEVLAQFESLLREKHIPQSVDEELKQRETVEIKWTCIFLNETLSMSGDQGQSWLAAGACVQDILEISERTDVTVFVFRAVRVFTILRAEQWTAQLIAAGGHMALIKAAKNESISSNLREEALATLLALTIHAVVIEAISKCVPTLGTKLASTATTSDEFRLILRLLSVITQHSAGGRAAVFESLRGDGARLRVLSTRIFDPSTTLQEQVVIMGFLNLVVEDSELGRTVDLALASEDCDRQLSSLVADEPEGKNECEAALHQALRSQIQRFSVRHSNETSFAGTTPVASAAEDRSIADPIQVESSSSSTSTCNVPKTSVLQLQGISPTSISMENILAALQQGIERLDKQTHTKMMGLLSTLADSLKAPPSSGLSVVDKLERSLAEPVTPPPPTPCSKIKLTLLPTPEDMVPSPLAPRSSDRSSHETERSPSRSRSETESAESPEQDAPARRAISSKLMLPFFQHLKRGQMLPTTPAPTPLASASVRKDGRHHAFPSFACPSPMQVQMQTPVKSVRSIPPLAFGNPGLELDMPSCEPLAAVREDDADTPASVKEDPATPPSNIPSAASSSMTVAPDADISRFRKLLQMGAPRAAVQAKMVQAGVDPALLDQPAQAIAVSTVPVAQSILPTEAMESNAAITPADVAPPSTGTDISKFRKLLSMGAPLAAVKAKMVQAGLDPALIDQKVGFASRITSSTTESAIPTAPASTPSVGVETGAVNAMKAASSVEVSSVGATSTVVPSQPPAKCPATCPDAASNAGQAKCLVKDDPEYAKFFKLLSMHAPPIAVKAKMVQAGLNPDLLDTPNAEFVRPASAPAGQPSNQAPPPAVPAVVRVKDDPEYAKFFKLLSMHAPAAAVKAKMMQAGLNPDLLDTPDAEMPAKPIAPIASAPASSSDVPQVQPVASAAPAISMVKDDPEYAKFFKLLSMHAPVAAVKAKMTQAGLNPDLLDTPNAEFVRPGSAPNAVSITQTQAPPSSSQPIPAPAPAVVKVKDDPEYAKFFKLLSMHAPAAAVKAKMMQAGLNPDFLDTPDADLVRPAASATATEGTSQASVSLPVVVAAPAVTKVKDDPEYAKFFKLLSMHAPAAAVKAKMTQAGLNPDLLDTPDADLVRSAPPTSTAEGSSQPSLPVPVISAVPAAVKVKDDPEYAKFFKLLAMHAPPAAVKAKMTQAGLNPDLLDTPDADLVRPEAASAAQSVAPAPAPAAIKVKDDPEYAKFFKLLAMHAPPPAVKAKMVQAGLNPDLLDTPDADLPRPSGSGDPAPAPPAKVKVKDDPEYAKFFKLLTMHAPPAAVKAKMAQAGLNPDLLDTPDADMPSAAPAAGNASAQQAPAPPASAASALSALFGKRGGDANSTAPDAALSPPPAPVAAPKRANLALNIKPAPKPTTRPFYWQQLKGDAVHGTVWEELEKESQSEGQQDNQLALLLTGDDLGLLETEFAAQTAPMTGPGTHRRAGSMESIPKDLLSPKVVFLIERSRSNNISIIIKQFRMSHATIREAIMKVDIQVLTLERVQGLIKILPTDEEVALIAGFTGDVNTLNDAERCLKELITVPRLKQRLLAMQYQQQFPTMAKDLQHKVESLHSASTQIAQSSEFKAILLVVLQVGNKMNQGTARGGAKGFKLGDLVKLAQLKSTDKGSTLLHYVARMIRLKRGNLVRLGDALPSLYDVQHIPMVELPGDMSKVTEVTDYITNELGAQNLKNALEEHEACDLFVPVMTAFLEMATETTKKLKDDVDATFALLQKTMAHFGFTAENSSSDTDPVDMSASSGGDESGTAAGNNSAMHEILTGAGEFFTTIYEFSNALMKADKENEVKRVREERAKQAQKGRATPLGPRSRSSRDLLSGFSTPIPKATLDAPSTQDKDKTGEAATPATRSSPGQRQRSASLSAIAETSPQPFQIVSSRTSVNTNRNPPNSASAPAVDQQVKDATPADSTSKNPAELAGAPDQPTTGIPKPSTSPSDRPLKTPRPIALAIPPVSHLESLKSPGAGPETDLEAPKPPRRPSMLPPPGKIVKTGHFGSICKPETTGFTIVPMDGITAAIEAAKKPRASSPEHSTPFAFDMASIQELRAQRAKPTATSDACNDDNNNCERSSASASAALTKSTAGPEHATDAGIHAV